MPELDGTQQAQNAIEQTQGSAKQRVLDAAEEQFMAQGYTSVTLRDVADALSMKQASLYYHFPGGKEELFVAVAERAFARHQSGMQRAIDAAPPDLRSRLHAVASWFDSQPPLNLMGMMYADMPALHQTARIRLGESAYHAMFTPLRTIFQAAQRAGETRNTHPDLLAGFFLTLMDSLTHAVGRVGAPPRRTMIDEIVTMMLDGISIK
ncbi:MAG: TetR/AcrR family transcriptional regulator [Caldilineaceae bacterium]